MSFRSLGLLAALAAVLCIGSMAGAETITYQEGAETPFVGGAYEGAEDNTLQWLSHTVGLHDNRNYGALETLTTGYSGNDADRTYRYTGLLRFDLTSLAGEYASIDSIKLRLYPLAGGSVVDFTNNLQLLRFTAANGGWVEGTNDTQVAPLAGASCWNYRAYNTDEWASGVEGTAAADYENGTIASTAFGPNAPAIDWMELSFTDLSFIGDWVAGNNTGMAIKVETDSAHSKLRFHSSDATGDNAQYRPQLVVEYTPIPEPSSLVLLVGLGLLGFAAWRRRS